MEREDFPIFQKYCSIENSYRDKEVQYIRDTIGDDSAEWVAQEKIHGCNFSATTDGDMIKWGSRTSYLGDGGLSGFNNSVVATSKYAGNVMQLFSELKAMYPDLKHIQVLGELFGGIYPGLQLPHRYKAIQKGVHYTPDIEFMVFDIKLGLPPLLSTAEEIKSTDNTKYDNFMNPDDVIRHCRSAGLRALDVLHRGTLSEMLQLNASFQTTIPDLFGLPTLDGNAAEGYVIKPVISVATDRGRIILKHKNPKFAENVSEKTVAVKTTTAEFTEEDEQIFLEMQQYINHNRFNAVMSKLEDDKKSNEKAVLGLTVKDAMDDIMKDFSIAMAKKTLFHRKLFEYAKVYWDENRECILP